MNTYEAKLAAFLEEHTLAAEHLIFTQSCHSVSEAAATVGAEPTDFIKSICCSTKNRGFIVCILKGEDKLDLKKVKAILNTDISIAKPEIVLEKTGYPVGGTPPIGYQTQFFIDERVMQKDYVYAGGGSPQALLRIAPHEIVKVNNGRIVEIKQ